MKSRSKLGLIAAIAAIAGMGVESPLEPVRKKRIQRSLAELNSRRGMKEFFYGENSIWAINQKNADRKAKLNNLI